MNQSLRESPALLERSIKGAVQGDNPFILVGGGLLLLVGVPLSLGLLLGPLATGVAAAALRVARGGQADLSALKTGFRHFLPASVAGLAVVVLWGLGSMLLVVPGLVLAFFFTFTFSVLADRPELTGVESLAASVRMTRQAPLTTAVFWLLALGGIVILSLVPVIGTGAGLGLAAVLNAQFYLKLRDGQPQLTAYAPA